MAKGTAVGNTLFLQAQLHHFSSVTWSPELVIHFLHDLTAKPYKNQWKMTTSTRFVQTNNSGQAKAPLFKPSWWGMKPCGAWNKTTSQSKCTTHVSVELRRKIYTWGWIYHGLDHHFSLLNRIMIHNI